MDTFDILNNLNVHPIFVDDIDDPEAKSAVVDDSLALLHLVKLMTSKTTMSIQAVRRRQKIEITDTTNRSGFSMINNDAHFSVDKKKHMPCDDFINDVKFSYKNNNNIFNLTIKNIIVSICKKEYPVNINNFTLFISPLRQHLFALDYKISFIETIPVNSEIFVDYIATLVDNKVIRNTLDFKVSSNGLTMNELYKMYNEHTKERKIDYDGIF